MMNAFRNRHPTTVGHSVPNSSSRDTTLLGAALRTLLPFRIPITPMLPKYLATTVFSPMMCSQMIHLVHHCRAHALLSVSKSSEQLPPLHRVYESISGAEVCNPCALHLLKTRMQFSRTHHALSRHFAPFVAPSVLRHAELFDTVRRTPCALS